MKSVPFSAAIFALLLSSCATTYQTELQRIIQTETEWQKANAVIVAEIKSGSLDQISGVRKFLGNCIRYTNYEDQRLVCNFYVQYFEMLVRGEQPSADVQKFITEEVPIDALAYYPGLPILIKANDYCMANGDPAEKISCVRRSRILENFAEGRLTVAEFKRQNALITASIQQYYQSQPTFADILFGAMDVYSQSVPKTSNCYGQVVGNQVYAQCQ